MNLKEIADGVCICADCRMPYGADLIVPDDVWEKISPAPVGGDKGGGLLCPTCIMERVTKTAGWTVGFVSPTDLIAEVKMLRGENEKLRKGLRP